MARYTQNNAPANTSYQKGSRFADRSFFADDKNIYYTAAGIAVAGAAIAGLASMWGGGGSSGGGGDTPTPEPSGELSDMTPEEFKTSEYTNTNALAGIKAAEAYSHIYQKDEKGNIFGHQADSTDRIAKIKVGVIDNGTFANSELSKDMVKTYNINKYSLGFY